MLDWLNRQLTSPQLFPYKSGANNEGYLVYTNEKRYFFKHYVSDNTGEKINREISFITHCLANGCIYVPKLIAYSYEDKFALFEYIEPVEDIRNVKQSEFVSSAVEFIRTINQTPISTLPVAADAAFEFSDFEALVVKRIKQLQEQLFPTEVKSSIMSIVESVESAFKNLTRFNVERASLPVNRCASPSDFGMHNFISAKKQGIFIDFEFAGQDSVWKLIADFFAQPQYPIAPRYIDKFMPVIGKAGLLYHRSSFVYVYKLTLLKWTLLMLQTGLRLYENDLNKLRQHIDYVNFYMSGQTNKILLMNEALNKQKLL